MHLLILVFAIVFAGAAYAVGARAPKEKWELLRKVSNGKAGLYKRRKHVKFGKFERAFSTYAVMRNASPEKVWSFVWKIDRIERGGRTVGLGDTLDTAGQKSLHEVGFSPPVGLYAVYTGEEDHLSYPEREQYVLDLYKKTAAQQKGWRQDRAFAIRKTLARWRLALLAFVFSGVLGTFVAPMGVEAPQVVVWTLLGMMAFGLAAGIGCVVIAQRSVMWAQASGAALLAGCLVGVALIPPALLGANALAFSTLCEGSVPVERSWTEGSAGDAVHYADVTLPASCQFDAHKTPVADALHQEFQAGRRVVDVVVSQGILGYKRIKLIGS